MVVQRLRQVVETRCCIAGDGGGSRGGPSSTRLFSLSTNVDATPATKVVLMCFFFRLFACLLRKRKQGRCAYIQFKAGSYCPLLLQLHTRAYAKVTFVWSAAERLQFRASADCYQILKALCSLSLFLSFLLVSTPPRKPHKGACVRL